MTDDITYYLVTSSISELTQEIAACLLIKDDPNASVSNKIQTERWIQFLEHLPSDILNPQWIQYWMTKSTPLEQAIAMLNTLRLTKLTVRDMITALTKFKNVSGLRLLMTYLSLDDMMSVLGKNNQDILTVMCNKAIKDLEESKVHETSTDVVKIEMSSKYGPCGLIVTQINDEQCLPKKKRSLDKDEMISGLKNVKSMKLYSESGPVGLICTQYGKPNWGFKSNQVDSKSSTMKSTLESKDDKKKTDKEENCTICFDGFSNPHILTCGHVFCKTCIDTWMNLKPTCPVCVKTVISPPIKMFVKL